MYTHSQISRPLINFALITKIVLISIVVLSFTTLANASGGVTCHTDYNGNTICVDGRR